MFKEIVFLSITSLLFFAFLFFTASYFNLTIPLIFSLSMFGTWAYYRWVQLKPSHDRLAKDLTRLEKVVSLRDFRESNFDAEKVKAYYCSTTFRDYRLLEHATGCNAMHTELAPNQELPFKAGHLHQLIYVIAHMNDQCMNGQVLEVGFGKGSNSIFLSHLFPNAIFCGVDLVEEHVTYARNYAAKANKINTFFEKGDASQPPISICSRQFDLMFGIESFCHIDTDLNISKFLKFAVKSLRPRGKIVIVDGFRSKKFNSLTNDVQQAMNLAESGFRICRMASKDTWKELGASAGFDCVYDIDLTDQAVGFWIKGWKVAQCLLKFPKLLHLYFSSSPKRAETGANFVSVLMTAYAMSLGSAEYGVLVLQKHQ